jgi:CRISPR/Cas system CSM-associated protein Csm4 (group 5 of RAMP superfamily)
LSELIHSKAIHEQEYKPLPIKKLRRVFETAEKGLDRYLHPKLKKMNYFTVKELEKFIDLGHSAKDFLNLMQEIKQVTLPDITSSKVVAP